MAKTDAGLNLLNTVREVIVQHANVNGLVLERIFGTRERYAEFVFAITIKALMEHGKLSMQAAYDIVMGAGAFQALADDLWTAHNAA